MERKTPSAANALYYGLLALAAITLAGTTILATRATVAMRTSIDWVTHTYEVIERVQTVRALVGEVESYQRGYLLTGQENYLLPYRRAADRLRQELLELQGATLDSGAQSLRAGALRRAALARLAYAEETVQVRDQRGFSAAAARVAGGLGSQDAEIARGLCDAMIVAERQLLRARSDDLDADIQRTNATILIANAFALLAAFVGFFLIRRSRSAWERTRIADLEAAKAREASREKSAFLASMSHEIRTPMNAIFGFTQLLAQHVRGEREQQYVRAIVTSGETLLALINDILDLSKIEAGRMELQAAPADVRELVHSTLAVFAQMAVDKRLRLVAEVDPEVPASLVVDAIRLRQVLFNLIGNAVKYTDEGGITVRARSRAGDEPMRVELELAVEDTGIGIAADQLKHIFDPFVQARPVDTRVREGSGLGLSITLRLVELMGGEIRVHSEPGVGSVFRVTLPSLLCVPAHDEPAPDPALPVDFDRLEPACILVVDDVAWNRELLVAFLAGSQHRVLVANSGVEAIALTREHRPQVVLMDIRMPGIDGRQARDRIRADPELACVRIVAVTASSLRSEDEALHGEFDGYVRKPLSREDLYRELERLLGQRTGVPAAPQPAPAAPPPADSAALSRAYARLHELEQVTWPRLRDALRMREATAFARELLELARVLGATELAAWAQRLARSLDAFDVGTAEMLLRQFPELAAGVKPHRGDAP